MKVYVILIVLCFSCIILSAHECDTAVEQAEASSKIAGYSLSKVQRWLYEKALPAIDKETGLYIADGHWNYRDTAADCYPFFTWAAWATDQEVLNHEVRSVLDAEQQLCNHVDRIPVPYDLKARKKIILDYDEMMFQASEYVKDGLIAIVEVTGDDEWLDRMRAIEDDIWKHARIQTKFGKIPSKNVEVNGEQIQALTRLFTMTGEEKYLHDAERLADYYLSDTEWVPSRLRDHGCEIIGGLGLLLAVESVHYPEKANAYAARIKTMFETILKKGTNKHGFMYDQMPSNNSKDTQKLSDGWGYNYVGFLDYDMATENEYFTPFVKNVLDNIMNPAYRNYRWERSIDGFADSIEGALYLLNRIPVANGFAWVDREMANHVVFADAPLKTADLWGTMKLQSNAVRTVIMHALMHTQGVLARPWESGMQLGAAPYQDGIVIVLQSQTPWQGILEFDRPRHRLYMGFHKDWPRMNTLPEWYTVEPERNYSVTIGKQEPEIYTGAQLHRGLSVTLDQNQKLIVEVHNTTP